MNELKGTPIRITRGFEASILCPDEKPFHTIENLRVTVLFWILEGLEPEDLKRHEGLYDQAYESAAELNKAIDGTGLRQSPDYTVTVNMLKRAPQVSSICHN